MILDLAHLSEQDTILLNHVAEDIRKPYNELVTGLSEGHENNIDWIVSSIASRSIFLSPLVWHCYHLGFIREKLKQSEIPAKIIVHDPVLAKVIQKFTEKNYRGVQVHYAGSLKPRAKAALKPLYQFGLATRLLRLYIAARRQPATRPLPEQPATLIDTFVLGNSFAKGDYNDRYYPGMREALGSEELEQVYYVPTFIGITKRFGDAIRHIRRSSYRFLLKEDVLQPSDYWFAFTHFFRRKKISRFYDVDFLGFDIAPLVNRELTSTAWDSSTILALLIYKFTARLRERGVRLRLVVDWFENQVIDRALHAGLQQYYPDVPTAGYSGFVVSSVYNFYMHPTVSEHATGIVPKECNVIGVGHSPLMKEYCPELSVQVAPAYRFGGVWRERSAWPDDGVSSVLIALPIGLRESVEILRVVLPFCTSAAGSRIQFRIKAHPSIPVEVIKQSVGVPLPSTMEFVDGDFNTWVERSHVLISNSSSTCVEALAKGIPVVIIGSLSGITQNPVPDTIRDDIWSLCYTPEEVAAALERYLNRDEQTRQRHEETGKRIRADYFEPVTANGSRRFLRLPPMPDTPQVQ